jgi:hypothetical protein
MVVTLICGYLLLFSKSFRGIIAAIPQHWLIGIQTFRLLGFWAAFSSSAIFKESCQRCSRFLPASVTIHRSAHQQQYVSNCRHRANGHGVNDRGKSHIEIETREQPGSTGSKNLRKSSTRQSREAAS